MAVPKRKTSRMKRGFRRSADALNWLRMGLFGTATQAGGGTLDSAIKGGIGSVTVAADLRSPGEVNRGPAGFTFRKLRRGTG